MWRRAVLPSEGREVAHDQDAAAADGHAARRTPHAILLSSIDRTTSAHTARVALTVTIDDGDTNMKITATGAIVGDAVDANDHGIVCLDETTSSGATYEIADIAAGPAAGTFYGNAPCPSAPTPTNIAALGSSW